MPLNEAIEVYDEMQARLEAAEAVAQRIARMQARIDLLEDALREIDTLLFYDNATKAYIRNVANRALKPLERTGTNRND